MQADVITLNYRYRSVFSLCIITTMLNGIGRSKKSNIQFGLTVPWLEILISFVHYDLVVFLSEVLS